MSPTSSTYVHLAPKPNSSYRQLFVRGRNIAARTLYGHHVNAEYPMTPEQIAEDRDLPVDVVKEAIAYCQSNPPEIAADLAADEAVMAATGMSDPDYKYHGRPKLLSPEEIARIRRSVYETLLGR